MLSTIRRESGSRASGKANYRKELSLFGTIWNPYPFKTLRKSRLKFLTSITDMWAFLEKPLNLKIFRQDGFT